MESKLIMGVTSTSFPVCLTDSVHVLLHVGGPVRVTPNIDLDSIKYEDFLIFGSAYK